MKQVNGHDVNKNNQLILGYILENQYVDLIRRRLGIVVKIDSPDLRKAIQKACDTFSCTPEEYLLTLSRCGDDAPEIEHLVSSITIGETYFFRDKSQMKILSDVVLPDIIRQKRMAGSNTIRIWSAGCSSGEEIYTIAMMLEEMLSDRQKWQIQLLGTDINVNVLKKAMTGRYTEWSMRAIPEEYKKRYFTISNNTYQLSEKIINSVFFEYLNLSDDVYPSMINNTGAQDLILCRNVLIYFDSMHIELLMKRISKCLVPGGYLLLGSSDPVNLTLTTLSRSSESPSLCRNIGNITTHVVTPEPEATTPFVMPVQPVVTTKNNLISTEHKIQTPLQVDKSEEMINDLLFHSKWNELVIEVDLLLIRVTPNAFLLTSKATALANLGRIDDAIKNCLLSLAIDKSNAWTYFVLALSYSEKDDIKAAESAFRKAIFLDYKFAICHLQLGLFLMRHNKHSDGVKSLKNALKITASFQPDAIVPYANGISYKHLGEILEHEIELYAGATPHE